MHNFDLLVHYSPQLFIVIMVVTVVWSIAEIYYKLRSHKHYSIRKRT